MNGNVTVVRGDILTATEQIICHQVNLLGVMGAGLALKIRNKYPEVYDEYVKYCKGAKLGDVLFAKANDGKIVANIFGQHNIGRTGLFTDYEALYVGLIKVRRENMTTAIPYKIGCGLGGGDWGVVSNLIGCAFFDTNVMIYRL